MFNTNGSNYDAIAVVSASTSLLLIIFQKDTNSIPSWKIDNIDTTKIRDNARDIAKELRTRFPKDKEVLDTIVFFDFIDTEFRDDFSIATIALSLKAISIDAQLYHRYAASDRLLLSANDYHDIGSSKTMQKIGQLASDSELATLIGVFYIALSNKTLKKISNNVFDIEMPAIIIGEGKTIITKEDVKQAEKEYGELTNVVIAGSVTGIGESAFSCCSGLTSVVIPDSVTSIGSYALSDCRQLANIVIPKGSRQRFEGLLESDLHSKLVEQ